MGKKGLSARLARAVRMCCFVRMHMVRLALVSDTIRPLGVVSAFRRSSSDSFVTGVGQKVWTFLASCADFYHGHVIHAHSWHMKPWDTVSHSTGWAALTRPTHAKAAGGVFFSSWIRLFESTGRPFFSSFIP